MNAPETSKAPDATARRRGIESLLDLLHAETDALLHEYSEILQSIALSGREISPRKWIPSDKPIDEAIERLMRPSPLPGAESDLVFNFLAEVRVSRTLDAAIHGIDSAASAHMLAMMVFSRFAGTWRNCMAEAERRMGPKFLFYNAASMLLLKRWPSFGYGRIQDLYAMVDVEYHAARAELRRRAKAEAEAAQSPKPISIVTDVVTVHGTHIAIYPIEIPKEPGPQRPAAPQPTQDRFPTPPGARWSDVSIRFTDGHSVRITAGEVTRLCNFTQMGMNDGRSSQPDVQWELLCEFAEGRGVKRWDSAASPKHQKRKENLADALVGFFGIPGEPIVTDSGDWRTVFQIEPEAKSRSQPIEKSSFRSGNLSI